MEACNGLPQSKAEWLCLSAFKMHLYSTSCVKFDYYTQILSQGNLLVFVSLSLPLTLKYQLPEL